MPSLIEEDTVYCVKSERIVLGRPAHKPVQ